MPDSSAASGHLDVPNEKEEGKSRAASTASSQLDSAFNKEHAPSATPSRMSISSLSSTRSRHDNDAATSEKPEEEQTGADLTRVQSSEYPTKLKLLFILLAVVLSVFLVALDMTIVATAIPRITDEFNSLQDVGWYGSAFFLTVASFQSTWGKAYKFFLLKPTFLLSIFIFEIGSLICAVAKNSTTLIVGRAIAGAGGAGIASGAYTIINFSSPPGQAAAYTGILGAVYAVASVVGPLLGGVFTDKLSWRWCFYINLPIGGVSAALILLLFTTPKKAHPQQASWREKILQMDLGGTFILMGAAVCFILAMQWGGVTKAWGSPDVVGTLVGFFAVIAVFIANEIWLGDRALIVPRLVKQKTIALLGAFQFFNSGTFLLLLYYLPIYFQVVSGVSAAQSGVRNLPFVLGISLLTIVSGITISSTGRYIEVLLLGAILSAVGVGMIYTFDLHTPSRAWIGYQALNGIGVGLSIQIRIIVSQAIVEAADVSSITAIMIFFQTFAGAIFLSISQTLFTNRLKQEIARRLPDVDPGLVVATGATDLRRVFDAQQLPAVIQSYMAGLKDAYVLGVALACVAVLWVIAIVLFDRRTLKGKQAGEGSSV